MKIVFKGTETASISAVKSVSVSGNGNRVEVLVKHKTEKQDKEKVSVLPDIRKTLTDESASAIANEIKSLIEAPDMLIDRIVAMQSWERGYISVPFERDEAGNVIMDDLPAVALARLCWWWPTRQAPTDKQLELRMQMDIDTINKIAKTEKYQQSVKSLMSETRTPEEFKEWVKSFRNSMRERFGGWMRLEGDTVAIMVDAVAKQHGVDLTENKRKSTEKADKPDQQEWEVFWGCYKEPDGTSFIPYGRTNVEAPTLARAKTLATQELNDWIDRSIEEPDEVRKSILERGQESIKNGLAKNKGRWEDGRNKSNRTIGQHGNTWSGLFVQVKLAK